MTASQATDDGGRLPGKRFGCLLYSLSCLAVLVLVVGLAYFIWYSNARSELDSEIARIKSRSEPLFFADLAPADLDPESDGTSLFLLAIAKVQAASPAFYDRLYDEPTTTPGDYPELAAGLAVNGQALDLLRQATAKLHFRLPIDYQTKQPFAINLDPIQKCREFAWLLDADVIQSLGTGDNDRAVAAVQECLALSHMLREEPFIITQLVRYAIGFRAMLSVEAVVANVELTPKQFAALDDQLDQMQRMTHIRHSIIAERCAAFTTMCHLSENRETLVTGTNDPDETARVVRMHSVPGLPYLVEDQAYMLRTATELADAVDKQGAEGSVAALELMQRLAQDKSRGHALTRLLVPAIGPFRGAALRFRQRLLNTRLALRIARYRQEHGELPTTLADILDDKLADAVDVYTGQPLVYQKNAEGFLLFPAEQSLTASVSAPQFPVDARELNTFKAQFKSDSTTTSVDSAQPQERQPQP